MDNSSETIIENLADPATPLVGDPAAETIQPDAVEFDYSLEQDEPAAVAVDPNEGLADTIESEVVHQSDEQILLRNEVAEARRVANEALSQLQRLQHAGAMDAEDIPAEPPKPRHQLETIEDLLQYQEWERKRESRSLRVEAALAASQAASEQRARGLLSTSALGEGFDYDAVIARHIAPVEKANPAAAKLFAIQKDPAMARYTIGLMLEAMEKFDNDPVRTFKAIRSALGAQARAGKDLVNRLNKAEEKGAQLVRQRARASAPRTTSKKITEADVNKMTNLEFMQFRNKLRRQA